MNRFTHQDYSNLVKWLEIKATDGKINARPGTIAMEAATHFGIVISAIQITNASEANGIEVQSNQVRDPEHPKNVLRQKGTQHERLCCIERRLDYLFQSLGVTEEDCP